jgi:predicted ABC-type ATPase
MAIKELIVVSGPNGAGKTTFAEEYSACHGCDYVGADAIAAELSPDDPARAQIAASREFLQRIDGIVATSHRLVVESTLSGRTFQHVLRNAKSDGFEITIVYLFLGSANTCVDRVHQRVLKGGHDVHEKDIRRRFTRSIRNFWNLYRPLSDHWLLIYNSGNQPQDVAVGTSNEISVRDVEMYAQFQLLIEADNG